MRAAAGLRSGRGSLMAGALAKVAVAGDRGAARAAVALLSCKR